MDTAATDRQDLPDAGRPPRRSVDVTLERVGDEAILYDRRGRRAHVVNDSAARVFELCDGNASMQSVTEQLAAAFELPPGQVEGDVQAIVDTFRRLGVLV